MHVSSSSCDMLSSSSYRCLHVLLLLILQFECRENDADKEVADAVHRKHVEHQEEGHAHLVRDTNKVTIQMPYTESM